MKPTEIELKILGEFIGDECEQVGKVSRVNDQIWFDMAEKGWIEPCENDEGFRITRLGIQIRENE
ncbi:hypothetical protein EOK75_14245 (plasmid) [Pseudorhodobacter turbinis]|uniref:DUF3253 domain-containing protein n=1 Tax=Pseudorhodobacter turbinis TaxID=2500533 RepID=A0A4P8EIY3_9RHOB|nr:hypothetical protein [Pseudorhodobacter turbinis]QCO56956.1 hypothetical protein EOK75_14245 [Pseudorhodobacter turbinis]